MLNAFYDEEETDVTGFEEEKSATPSFNVYDAIDGVKSDDEGLVVSPFVNSV